MSTIVTRIYETYGDALSATNELARNGFGKDAVSLVSNAPNREADADAAEGSASAIETFGIPTREAGAWPAGIAAAARPDAPLCSCGP